MPLVVDQLQLWSIGFRWSGLDPNRIWLRIPTSVRDNFSTLLNAILQGHLDCMTLALKKYHGDEPEIAKSHIHPWIEDVYAGVFGQSYNRKLLKHAIIDRWAFHDWCERCSIPLPEFWFPPGWTEYRWPEDDPPLSAQAASSGSPGLVSTEPINDSPPTSSAVTATPPNPESDPALKWRPEVRIRVACQVIAEVLWKANPDMTITAMSKHELVRKYGQGDHYEEDTVYDWVKVVAPPEVRAKRGRPKKKNPSQDE